MSKHRHAELMALYAQDALETDRPWERWEFRPKSRWLPFLLGDHPLWEEECEYRRKPKTSRERFEEWAGDGVYMSKGNLHYKLAWDAWQEAERQAKESG